MKLLLAALTILLAPAIAWAQARVDRVAITEYGIYDTVSVAREIDANGIGQNSESDIRHVGTATKIPARAGLAFGMRYKVIGAPAGEPVTLTKVIIFPKGGLHPKGRAALATVSRPVDLIVGAESFTDYKFDEPWEMVPGPWTFEFWLDGRKLAEKTFIVVVDETPIS